MQVYNTPNHVCASSTHTRMSIYRCLAQLVCEICEISSRLNEASINAYYMFIAQIKPLLLSNVTKVTIIFCNSILKMKLFPSTF